MGDGGQADRDRWNARYREAGPPGPPSDFLVSLDAKLPRSGTALDVASGTGRHALWLAGRGLEVTCADVSDVGLEVALRAAAGAGLRVRTLAIDLEREAFPPGPWDVITCFYFLHRPLFDAMAHALSKGGLVVVAHPTMRNLEAHPKPGPAHLLQEGELRTLLGGLELLHYTEGWTPGGRHEARALARRPAAAVIA